MGFRNFRGIFGEKDKKITGFQNIEEYIVSNLQLFFCLFSPKILRKFRKPMNQSPQQQQRRKFQKFAENSENLPKIP